MCRALLLLSLPGCTFITSAEHSERLAQLDTDPVVDTDVLPLLDAQLESFDPELAVACGAVAVQLEASVDGAWEGEVIGSAWRLDGSGDWLDGPDLTPGIAVERRSVISMAVSPPAWPPPLADCDAGQACTHSFEVSLRPPGVADETLSSSFTVVPDVLPSVVSVGLHDAVNSSYVENTPVLENNPPSSLSSERYNAVEVWLSDPLRRAYDASSLDWQPYKITLLACPDGVDPGSDGVSQCDGATTETAVLSAGGDWGVAIETGALAGSAICLQGPRQLWLQLDGHPCQPAHFLSLDELPLLRFSDGDCDGDGYSVVDGDCDDAVATTHPGVSETCAGPEDDCDSNPIRTMCASALTTLTASRPPSTPPARWPTT